MDRVLLTVATAAIFLSTACGTSSPRTLQSVSATPAAADARNFPNGQVKFTVTGKFSKSPITVTPLPVTAWEATPDGIATVSSDGTAECKAGSVGTANIPVAPLGEGTGALRGVATLTCP